MKYFCYFGCILFLLTPISSFSEDLKSDKLGPGIEDAVKQLEVNQFPSLGTLVITSEFSDEMLNPKTGKLEVYEQCPKIELKYLLSKAGFALFYGEKKTKWTNGLSDFYLDDQSIFCNFSTYGLISTRIIPNLKSTDPQVNPSAFVQNYKPQSSQLTRALWHSGIGLQGPFVYTDTKLLIKGLIQNAKSVNVTKSGNFEIIEANGRVVAEKEKTTADFKILVKLDDKTHQPLLIEKTVSISRGGKTPIVRKEVITMSGERINAGETILSKKIKYELQEDEVVQRVFTCAIKSAQLLPNEDSSLTDVIFPAGTKVKDERFSLSYSVGAEPTKLVSTINKWLEKK